MKKSIIFSILAALVLALSSCLEKSYETTLYETSAYYISISSFDSGTQSSNISDDVAYTAYYESGLNDLIAWISINVTTRMNEMVNFQVDTATDPATMSFTEYMVDEDTDIATERYYYIEFDSSTGDGTLVINDSEGTVDATYTVEVSLETKYREPF